MLLEAEANPKAEDSRYWTVLMIATANLNPNDPASEDIVKELLKNEADPNAVNHLWTALMFATRSGSINAVRTLIEYEAEADILLETYDQGPRSPFICAEYAPTNQLEIKNLNYSLILELVVEVQGVVIKRFVIMISICNFDNLIQHELIF